MPILRIFALSACLFGAGVVAAQNGAATTQIPDHDVAIAFLHSLQIALRSNDIQNVEKLVHYPLRVDLGGHEQVIKTKSQFIQGYPRIFTRLRITAIEKAKDEDVWYRDQGYSIKSGTIWFDNFNGRFALETVNQAQGEAG